MKKTLCTLFLLLAMLPLLAQNPVFPAKLNQARSLYNAGKYEKARSSIQVTLKNLNGLSADQKDEGRKLVAQCNQAIAHRDRFTIAKDAVSLGYQSGQDSVAFDAGWPKQVKATCPATWCKPILKEGLLVLNIDFNPNKQPRSTEVTLRMGKIKSYKISVKQEPRTDTYKTVKIFTHPDKARISVDDFPAATGLWENTLVSGKHKVHIEKSGYRSRDITLEVKDDMRNDDVMTLEEVLEPEFAKLQLTVSPEKGFELDKTALRVYMNGVQLTSASGEEYTYDDDRELARYHVYKDGTIPVPFGPLSINIQAPNFATRQIDTMVVAGSSSFVLDASLNAITGWLQLNNVGQAGDAHVLLDGNDIGTVGEISHHRTQVGRHNLDLLQEGYIAPGSPFTIEIEENRLLVKDVSMHRYARYQFTSTPGDIFTL